MPILVPSAAPIQGPGTPDAVLQDGQVTLGAITFGMTDDYGVEWILESLAGWSDLPSTTGDVEQRPTAHGGWNGPAYYAPRTIELEGTLIAANWAGASEALDRLMLAVPLSTPDWLVVNEGYRTLQAQVRQDGDPLVDRAAGHAHFSLSFTAADPRRYADTETTLSTGLPTTSGGLSLPLSLPLSIDATTTSGVFTATNAGNMSTPPTLTVAGPSPAFSITHRGSGKTIRFADPIAAGRTLTIDTAKRRAVLDGIAPRVVTGSWFEYDPGDNEIAFSAATYNSGALLTSVHRSAWR